MIQRRQHLQPLALQQLLTPIDAGDASNNGASNSGSNSSVAFNDLMSQADAAADQRLAREKEQAARRTAEQNKSGSESETKDSENTVAALKAAAEFAARNMKIKQRAAAEEQSRAEKASRSAAEKARAKAASKDSSDATNVPENAKSVDKAADLSRLTDGAASESSTKEPPHEGKAAEPASSDVDISTGDETQAAKTPTIDQQAAISHTEKLADQRAPVSIQQLTQDAVDPAVKNAQIAQAKSASNDASALANQSNADAALSDPNGTKNASAPAIANSLKASTNPSQNPDQDATSDQSDTGSKTAQAEDLDTSDGKTKDGQNDAATAAAATQQPNSNVQNDASMASLQVPITLAPQNSQLIEPDQVLTGRRTQNTEQFANLNNQSSTPQSAGQTAPVNSPELPTPAAELPIKPTWINPSENAEGRNVLKLQETSSAPAAQGDLQMATDSEQTDTTKTDSGELQPKFTDPKLTINMQSKANADQFQQSNPGATNVGVSLQELAKLGAKEITYHIEPKALPAELPQDQTPTLSPPTTTTTPTQAQTSAATTANPEANSERRSIAADIRLRAMERMVVAAARAGTETLTLQLYPPGLGQVMIRLVMDGQRLRIVTRAANAEAVSTLKEMEGDLRHALSGNGLDLAEFDVNDDQYDEEQARRQTPSEPTNSTSRGGKSDSFTIDMNA